LTLPSNSSMNIYPNNTTPQFVTKLPKHIELTGDWIVSLKEISVPITLVNIVPDTYRLEIKDTATEEVGDRQSLPRSMHIGIRSIINELNRLVKQRYGITFRPHMVHGRRWVRIELTSSRYSIRLNGRLSELLGFSAGRVFVRDRNAAEKPPKSPGIDQIHNLYVYCDIAVPVIVGDTSTPLLRIVEVTRDESRTRIHTAINTPLFVPIQKKSFNTIPIWIMTNEGKPAPVPDDAGQSPVVLELKKFGLLNSLIYKKA